MNDWTDITLNDLNKSQRRGAMRIIGDTNERAALLSKYGVSIEVELKRYSSTVSIIAKLHLNDLGEGNLLRFLEEREYFHAFIGKRGAVNAVTYPKSCEQFKGKRAFGINFK